MPRIENQPTTLEHYQQYLPEGRLDSETSKQKAQEAMEDALNFKFLEEIKDDETKWINENSYKNRVEYQAGDESITVQYSANEFGQELYISRLLENGESHFIDISTKEEGILDVKDEDGLSSTTEESQERALALLESINASLVTQEQVLQPQQEVILATA